MELIHSLTTALSAGANISFYFKFAFVLFLFIFNMYLILTYNKEEHSDNKETPILQSGFNNKKLKGFLSSLVYIGGFLGTIITMKNELKDIQIGKLDQLMEEERGNIRRSIDKDREEHQRLLSSIENNREDLFNLQIEKAKLLGHNDRLLSIHNSLKDRVISYQYKSMEPTTKLSELGILDQLIKQDTNKFAQELNSLISNIGHVLPPVQEGEGEDTPTLGEGSADGSSDPHKGTTSSTLSSIDDLKESSFLHYNIFTSMDWFESLNGIKKLAVSLIISKSVVFSALTSIIFIFYGNILIEKYDLVNRYPKLSKFIQLRQKFQKYYFNYYCGLILLVIITEVAFALAVLF